MYTSMSIAPPHTLQGDLVQVALRGISGRLAESVVMQGAAAMNYRNIQRGGRAEAKSHHKSAGMADDSCACCLHTCRLPPCAEHISSPPFGGCGSRTSEFAMSSARAWYSEHIQPLYSIVVVFCFAQTPWRQCLHWLSTLGQLQWRASPLGHYLHISLVEAWIDCKPCRRGSA